MLRLRWADRPEKNHKAQVEAFAQLLRTEPRYREDTNLKLVLLGGSRNADDGARVEELRTLAKKLGVEVGDLSFPTLPLPRPSV